jgi:phosphoribosylaminoimidazolecarboxamide formyltransferase / IMP cyclohydrolase
MPLKPIQRALISVSDKNGLIPFVKFLNKQKVQILSTGGTLKALKEAGIPAVAVEQFTGFPEILEGRVKTLHPKIHGGLLYRREKKEHAQEAKKHGIEAIDLVVVNLYPFEKVTSNPDVTLEAAIENIDIGGPSMLRSAAKNHKSVTVVCDPEDYPELIRQMQEHKGAVSDKFKQALAIKVFDRTSRYDHAINAFFEARIEKDQPELKSAVLPEEFVIRYRKQADLRYGENPHQAAAYYTQPGKAPGFKQLHGKELSFNNLLDIQAAVDVIREFEAPAACVIKHNNPCGIAEDKDIPSALGKAIECDVMSAFGGIIGINRACDLKTAEEAFNRLKFFEVFVAPRFELAALQLLKTRQNLRLIEVPAKTDDSHYDAKFMGSGLLVQTKDQPILSRMAELKKNFRFVTKKKLEGADIEALLFAFKCAKVVKSNAIVLTHERYTVGIGAGQMSRVDSVEIACSKAGYRTEGSFLGSDAFFPMPDSIEVAAEKKIRAIIQPGGSLRDADVIAACDRLGLIMAFTGERHFKH